MNNKGTDQPAWMCIRSLISAFNILLLESTISKLATSEISIFYLVSVAEETGLSIALLETTKTGFLGSRLICLDDFDELSRLLMLLNHLQPQVIHDNIIKMKCLHFGKTSTHYKIRFFTELKILFGFCLCTEKNDQTGQMNHLKKSLILCMLGNFSGSARGKEEEVGGGGGGGL